MTSRAAARRFGTEAGRDAVDRVEQAQVSDSGTEGRDPERESPEEGVPEGRGPEGGTLEAEGAEGEASEGGAFDTEGPEGEVSETEGTDEPVRTAVPYWLSQVPYALVLSALAAGIVVVAAAYFKRGPAIIAGALLLAATFRLFLPEDWIGMLAVRRRWVDLAVLTGLAALLIVLAWVAPQLST